MTVDYYLNRIMRAESSRELDRIAADIQQLPTYIYSPSEREIIFTALNIANKNF